jgi:hypothetical protein
MLAIPLRERQITYVLLDSFVDSFAQRYREAPGDSETTASNPEYGRDALTYPELL